MSQAMKYIICRVQRYSSASSIGPLRHRALKLHIVTSVLPMLATVHSHDNLRQRVQKAI